MDSMNVLEIKTETTLKVLYDVECRSDGMHLSTGINDIEAGTNLVFFSILFDRDGDDLNVPVVLFSASKNGSMLPAYRWVEITLSEINQMLENEWLVEVENIRDRIENG